MEQYGPLALKIQNNVVWIDHIVIGTIPDSLGQLGCRQLKRQKKNNENA